MLNNNIDEDLDNFIKSEVNENSNFIYPALELVKNAEIVRPLLSGHNQTLILKSVEVIKSLNELTTEDKKTALKNVTDENIKLIIQAL